jgi:hypothetical protein
MRFLKLVIPAVYLLAVCVCIALAFDFSGSIDTTWTGVLIILTLPWSIVSILFAWALIHGAGLGFFATMYLFFAGLNATALYFLFRLFGGQKNGGDDPVYESPPPSTPFSED